MIKSQDMNHPYKLDISKTIVYGLMYVLAIIYLIPLIWMLITAFIHPDMAIDLFSLSWPTLANLKRVLLAAPFGQYYLNTIIMVVATLLVQFVLITMAGYAFARLDFWGKNLLFMLFLMQLMITPDVLIMPNYSFMGQIGLIDTKLGVILPFFASGMGTFLMRQTIKTIPYELEEAAKMDGCRLPRMLLQIYVPLLKPVYIAFGLISASYQWNNFLWPLVMINSVNKRPLTVGLAIFAMSFETGAQWSDVCAATLIVIAPLLVLFLFFQRQFIESFAQSGIK